MKPSVAAHLHSGKLAEVALAPKLHKIRCPLGNWLLIRTRMSATYVLAVGRLPMPIVSVLMIHFPSSSAELKIVQHAGRLSPTVSDAISFN